MSIKTLVWKHDSCSVCPCVHIPQNHSKAMIEGHSQTDAIFLCESHMLSHKEPIIDDIMMRQSSSFREASSARCELYISSLIEVTLIYSLLEL